MKTILSILALVCCQSVYGQSAREVIESPRTEEGKIYFNHDLQINLYPGEGEYEAIENGQLISVKRSAHYESQMNANERPFKVYMKAYNPLHYSLNVSSILVVDSMNVRINSALNDMLDALDNSKADSNAFVDGGSDKGRKGNPPPKKPLCPYINDLNQQLSSLVVDIKQNEKEGKVEWIGLSQRIINLEFLTKSSTETELKTLSSELSLAKKKYEKIDLDLNSVRKEILAKMESDKDKLECVLYLEILLVKAERIQTLARDQKKYLDSFEQLLQVVQTEMKNWESEEKDNTWFLLVKEGGITRDSNAVVQLKLIKHTTSLDENGVVKRSDSEESLAKIQLIWHRTFVPELGTGVYYSLQKQNTYKMAADGQGGGSVVEIGQRQFDGVTISAMMNFYWNRRDRQVLPYWQIGLGMQNDLPLLMCGGGFRIGLTERAFSFGAGVSMTAIEGLDRLDPGDDVSDESEIEEDLHYKFSAPKLYFGIQYHF